MKYVLNLKVESLPTFCERVAKYWATKSWVPTYASGKASAMRYKSVRAFKQALRDAGIADEHGAYVDTLELARLILNAADTARRNELETFAQDMIKP